LGESEAKSDDKIGVTMKSAISLVHRTGKRVSKPNRTPSSVKISFETAPIVPRLKHILVPIDFSKVSINALRYAVPLAKQFGAKLTLLHVVEIPNLDPQLAYVPIDTTETRREILKRSAELVRRVIPKGVFAKTIVRSGVAFDAITSAARELKCDLIIITTHGYTGLKHIFIGSTAERVVRHASCPVLVVR
jgi:nucleotide-binding universal stress UspA family protein